MKNLILIDRKLVAGIIVFFVAFTTSSLAQTFHMPTSDLLLHVNYMIKEKNNGQKQRFIDDKYIHINGCQKRMDLIFAATGEIYESFRYNSYKYYPPCSETGWAECWIFNVVKQHPQDDLRSVALFVDKKKRETQFMMMFSNGTVIYEIDDPQYKDCY